MRATKGIVLFVFPVLLGGMALTSCTVVTDPTKPTTDVTSSTSPGSSSKSEKKAEAFINTNFARIKEDMVRGRGEHLASLATLLGVREERCTEFFSLTKEKFPSLIMSERTTSNEFLTALNHELAMHPYLRDDVTSN